MIHSRTLKFAATGTLAAITTLLCVVMMVALISATLDTPPSRIVNVATAFEAKPWEPQKPEVREKPEKILPEDLPEGLELMPENPLLELPSAALMTVGALSSEYDRVDMDFTPTPPVKDILALRVVQPVYPFNAVLKEIEGFAVVQFDVRENGSVANAHIVDSEPGRIFDDAAVRAVRKFKFRPREVGGDPLEAQGLQMRFAFNLESFAARLARLEDAELAAGRRE